MKIFRESFRHYHLLTEDEESRLLDAAAQGKARHLAPIIRLALLTATCISQLVMNGVDLVAVGRMAGWTDSSAATMVRRYTHHTPDYLHKAAATLERGKSWQNCGKSAGGAEIVPETRKEASA